MRQNLSSFVFTVFIFLTANFPAFADTIRLSCTSDDGASAGELVIDFSNNSFKHGEVSLTITENDPDYVTAIGTNSPSPGGQIWVIEKMTGRFARAFSGNICSSSSCSDEMLTAFSMSGRCLKPVL